MRWPSIASLDHPAPGTAESGQPHRDTAEKRRDLMFAVVLHATNTATDSAIRPANNGVLPGLSGNELLFSRLRVSGTAKMPQIDQSVRHQLHTVVALLFELKAQQKPFEFVLPGEGPLHAEP